MSLSSLIINRIIRDGEVTLAQLETRAQERGVSLSELYDTLEHVHRDKRITQTSNVKGEVTYRPATAKAPKPMTHLSWVSDHYPWPGKDGVPPFEMPFPEIDMSWMFLRSKEERDAYHAAAKGKPVYMVKSTYGKEKTR